MSLLVVVFSLMLDRQYGFDFQGWFIAIPGQVTRGHKIKNQARLTIDLLPLLSDLLLWCELFLPPAKRKTNDNSRKNQHCPAA
jgi:hypothetical protein